MAMGDRMKISPNKSSLTNSDGNNSDIETVYHKSSLNLPVDKNNKI